MVGGARETTFKEWLRQIKSNPEKVNNLDALANQAERQMEMDEIDTRQIIKAN